MIEKSLKPSKFCFLEFCKNANYTRNVAFQKIIKFLLEASLLQLFGRQLLQRSVIHTSGTFGVSDVKALFNIIFIKLARFSVSFSLAQATTATLVGAF